MTQTILWHQSKEREEDGRVKWVWKPSAQFPSRDAAHSAFMHAWRNNCDWDNEGRYKLLPTGETPEIDS